MDARKTIPALVALAGFAALLCAAHWQRALERGLPPRVECAGQAAAARQAYAFAGDHGGDVIAVLGTGSMAPYIPAAAPGADPLRTVVAYVVAAPRATFADIRPGALVVYRAAWSAAHPVLHQAASRDAAGWIMSGLHNPEYEARWRVTPANFVAIAAQVFTWEQVPRQ